MHRTPTRASSPGGRRTSGLLALLVLAACSGPVDLDVPTGALLKTHAASYTLIERGGVMEVSIPFTFENVTDRDLYLENCPPLVPPVLERRYGDEWRVAWTPHTYVCTPRPILVPPGARHVDTLHVHAHPFGGERDPQFRDRAVTGTYRLQLPHVWTSWKYEQRPFGDELAPRLRVSTPFELIGPSS